MVRLKSPNVGCAALYTCLVQVSMDASGLRSLVCFSFESFRSDMTTERTPRKIFWLTALVVCAGLTQTAIFLVRPTTTYKLASLGAGAFEVGLVTSLYSVVPLLLALPSAARAQVARSLRPFLLGGAALIAVGASVTAASDGVMAVALGSVTLGVGHLLVLVSGQAVVARLADPKEFDACFGWFTLGMAAGQLIGPLAAGLILDALPTEGKGPQSRASIDAALWVGASFGVASVVLLLVWGSCFVVRSQDSGERKRSGLLTSVFRLVSGDHLRRWVRGIKCKGCCRKNKVARQSHPRISELEASLPSFWSIQRTVGMKSHLYASLALAVTIDILASFLPLVAEERGISASEVGVLLAVRAAFAMISRGLLSPLRKVFARRPLVIVSLLVSSVGLFAIPFVIGHFLTATIVMAVTGFVLGLGQPLTMAAMADSVPPVWRSSSLSVGLMANRIGQVVVPLIAGFLAGAVGASSALWVTAVLLGSSGMEKTIRRR